MRSTFDQGHVVGASKSLKKSISELMEFLDHDEELPADKLRDVLHDRLCDLAERWFKKGFNRGHRESYAAFKSDGSVPRNLGFSGTRNLSPNRSRPVTLNSKIKKKKASKAMGAK